MENNAREGLHDYKVWCFNGQAKYVQYISGRMGGETREGFFDEEWNLQRFTYHNPKIQTSVPKPQCLAELFELANRLAEGMPFARIDFYVLQNNQIKFGEITFYPMGGIGKWHPEEMDKELGDLIDLALVSVTGYCFSGCCLWSVQLSFECSPAQRKIICVQVKDKTLDVQFCCVEEREETLT